jgi:hypothetical protein
MLFFTKIFSFSVHSQISYSELLYGLCVITERSNVMNGKEGLGDVCRPYSALKG